jgi:hypothetical protein
MPGHYRRDLRAPAPEGHTWEVELLSGTAGEAVTLELSALTSLPAGLALRVLDRELGTLSDPMATHVPLVSFGPQHPYRLAIIAGTEDYVRRGADLARIVPAGLTMDHGAPNPFRSATRIRFGLPRASQVSVEIYSVLGERVATLADRAPLESGYHALVWDGTRSNGGPVPSGVYLVRLVAGGEARSARLVMIR